MKNVQNAHKQTMKTAGNVHMHTCLCTSMYAWTHVGMYIYYYIHAEKHTYVYTYIHTYIHKHI